MALTIYTTSIIPFFPSQEIKVSDAEISGWVKTKIHLGWGHATSTDLYRWTNQPIAIHPINESSYIFSGSSVVDTNNTSGFFPDQDNGVVAIYTIATDAPVELQTQGLAISHDGGYTFEQYESNPVLDIGSSQFRDPKVIRYGDRWVMVIAYASEFTVGFFTSPDLKNWTHASNFSTQGWLGVQWECPNMVEIPVEGSDQMMHLLQVSVNPGSPQGGSVSQYFPGNFDGSTFTPVDGAARFTDFAKDNYAGQFFYGLPSGSRPIQMAWASNWEYTQVVPTGDSVSPFLHISHAISGENSSRLGCCLSIAPNRS